MCVAILMSCMPLVSKPHKHYREDTRNVNEIQSEKSKGKHGYSSDHVCFSVGHVSCSTPTHIIILNYTIFLNY